MRTNTNNEIGVSQIRKMFFGLLAILCLIPHAGHCYPKPDVYVSILPNEYNGREALGAYQDDQNPKLWYFLPLSFELEKRFYPSLNRTLPSFKHSFFKLIDPTTKEDNSHSFYQMVFVPIRYSDELLSKLKTKIAQNISVAPCEVTLSAMPLTNLYYKVQMTKNLSPSSTHMEYIDLFRNDDRDHNSVTIAQLYGGIPVELIVKADFEPTFSENLTNPVNAGLPHMGELHLAFKGQFQLIHGYAEVNYQKLFEFIEKRWTDREVSGWWLWKKERFIERTKVELANESLNSGITYKIKIDETLAQSVREVAADGQSIDKPLYEYVRDILADEITKRAFDVQTVMQGQDEVYRVSERAGTKSLTGTAKVTLDTSLIREVQVRAVFMMTQDLTADLIDPKLAKYAHERDGGN